MELETLIRDERDRLTRRLGSVLGGDVYAAEDLCQEAFTRAWQSLPRELDGERQRAWLRRTAGNLAIDELRRRARRPTAALDDFAAWESVSDAAEPDAAREALLQLPANERFLLLLRFQSGFTHAEIARLLDISEEAARKRVVRARATFLRAYRALRSDPAPLVLVMARDESPAPYVRWLEAAGARVRHVAHRLSERELALADGLVLSGAFRDVHSALYGEEPRSLRGEVDLAQDRADLAAVNGALALDLPMIGICRGHQLLNLASGGTLYQDIHLDGATADRHDTGLHRLDTRVDTTTRGLLGRSAQVHSEHHQAVRRLGRRLRIAAISPDGLIEGIERSDRRFAVGLQWHPEEMQSRDAERIADALIDTARKRAA
jgi:putative glutamine amidotransferase